MEETMRFHIERDPEAEDGIEIEKGSSGDYKIKVGEGMDLEKDWDAKELFAEKFNAAYRSHDIEKGNIFDTRNPRHRVEIERLNKAIEQGEEKFNLRIPTNS